MSLLSPTREANIRKLERRLRTAKYSKKDMSDAMKLASKSMDKEDTINVMDMSGKNAQKFQDIHNTLVLHSVLDVGKDKKNNKKGTGKYLDPNVTSNILSYLGGRSARRTRKKRARKSMSMTTTKSKRKYTNRTRRSRTKTRRRR